VLRFVALAAGAGVRAIARTPGVAPSSISRILRRPEVGKRVDRERECLAASAGDAESGRSQLEQLEEGSSAAGSEAVWLLLRSGIWGFGSRCGEAVVMRSFPAGLYVDLDEEVVAFVRKATARSSSSGRASRPHPSSVSGVRGRCRRMQSVALPPDRDIASSSRA